MKNKVLPFNLLVLFASVLLLSFTYTDEDGDWKSQKKNSENAAKYLVKIRNNQQTGEIDPANLIRVQQQIAKHKSALKGSDALDWKALGPDNFSGRTRAILYDNQDPDFETILAAGVTGGIWKSETGGITWNKANGENKNLFVSCMAQAANGTIYAGTGEAYNAEEYSQFGQLGYESGLMGSGLYKSTDGSNFVHISGTEPATAGEGWGYFSGVAFDDNTNRLFIANEEGLFYSTDEGASWQVPEFAIDSAFLGINVSVNVHCDSFQVEGDEVVFYGEEITMEYDTVTNNNVRNTMPIEGPAASMQMASDGSVAAVVDDHTFVYKGGDLIFESKAGYPENPYYIVKDSINYSFVVTSEFAGDTTFSNTEVTDYHPAPYELNKSIPTADSDAYLGAVEFAFAPSDPNVLYASAVNSSGDLINIYTTTDKGDHWRVVLPGDNSLVDIFQGSGIYANALAVHPTQPGKILAGSLDLWEGIQYQPDGYFQWEQRSISFGNELMVRYLHEGHHEYVYNPGDPGQFIVATNGGTYQGTATADVYQFSPLKKGQMTSQFYTVSYSPFKKEVMGGAQELGTVFISGTGNTDEQGEQIFGGNGGYNAISSINPDVFIYSYTVGQNRFFRSEDRGTNISTKNFMGEISIPDDDFLVPIYLWESFDDNLTRDSVYFYPDKDYAAGETVQVLSKNNQYPFYVTLEEPITDGDSLLVQDKVQSKLFMASRNSVWLSMNSLDFTENLNWFNIANTNQSGFQGVPSAIGLSRDANHLYVGTIDGRLFRISNIRGAYNYATADCRSEECIISTTEIPLDVTQAITSISVEPGNNMNVVVTLGNYGNENYVYRSTNALDSLPEFNSIQGDPDNGGLPQMPVYSSLIEMENTDLLIVGTEHGVYTTTNAGNANPTWTLENDGMGNVPVMMIKQQYLRKTADSVALWDGSDTTYTIYPGTNNYGVIYVATYGRGLYRTDKYQQPVGIEDQPSFAGKSALDMTVFPNPNQGDVSVKLNLDASIECQLNVYDLTGKRIYTIETGTLQAGENTLRVSLSDIPEGTYILQLISEGNSVSRKLMVIE